MKKKIIILIINTLIINCFSQNNTKVYSYWSPEKLSWSNFKTKPYKRNNNPYGFYYGIQNRYKLEKRYDTLFILNNYAAYYSPKYSWCLSEYQQDTLLKNFQLAFNYAEYKSRELQRYMNKDTIIPENWYNYEEDLDSIYSKVREQDYSIIDYYSNYYKEQIESIQHEYYPEYSFSNIGGGAGINIPYIIFSGGLNEYFKRYCGIEYFCNFYYNRLFISFGGLSFSGINSKKEIPGKNEYPRDSIYTTILLFPSLIGREYNINQRIRIYPMAGLSYNFLYSSSNNEKILSLKSLLSPSVGFSINYIVDKRICFANNYMWFSKNTYNQQEIIFKILISRNEFNENFKGFIISFGVGYNWYNESLNIKN